MAERGIDPQEEKKSYGSVFLLGIAFDPAQDRGGIVGRFFAGHASAFARHRNQVGTAGRRARVDAGAKGGFELVV